MQNLYIKPYPILTLLCVFTISVLAGVRPDWCVATVSVDGAACTYSAAFGLSCVLPLSHQQGHNKFFQNKHSSSNIIVNIYIYSKHI